MNKSTEIILSDIVAPILVSQVIPKLKHYIQVGFMKSVDSTKLESCFEDYLQRRYEKYSVMETLAFPNKQIAFNSLYQPLTVVEIGGGQLSLFDSNAEGYENRNQMEEIIINRFPKKFLPKYYRILLEDSAGMGKSTLSRKLFLSAIEENTTLPVLIELRNLSKENSIEDEIANQFFLDKYNIDKCTIIELITKGGFTIIFDGYDEISSNNKCDVTKDMQQFVERSNRNMFLITSRPEESLASFNSFYKFTIKPIKQHEATELIKKYDKFNHKPISKELLTHIEEDKNKAIKEYLINPFLISLLYKSFDYKKDIPLKKTQFYSQVYDALFESHDLSKEGYYIRKKYSNLHKDDFELIIRRFAFFSSIKNKMSFTKDEILHEINNVRTYLGYESFQSSDFLRDLIETVPLFLKDGLIYRWAHKSLQDYFTAKFIWIDAKKDQEPILEKIYNDDKIYNFYNILLLYAELDAEGFDRTISLWFLKELIAHHDLGTAVLSNYEINNIDLTDRFISTLFNQSLAILFLDNKNIRKDLALSSKSDFREVDFHNYLEKMGYLAIMEKSLNVSTYPSCIILHNIEKRHSRAMFIPLESSNSSPKASMLNLLRNTRPKLFERANHGIIMEKDKDIIHLEFGVSYPIADIIELENYTSKQLQNIINATCSYSNMDLLYSIDLVKKEYNKITQRIKSQSTTNDLLNW